MKLILFLAVALNSFHLYSQVSPETQVRESEEVNQELLMKRNDVPQVGKKAVPLTEEQQESPAIDNPFAIGPYQNGEYMYENADRDPDDQ